MLKLTSISLGLITLAAIVPASQTMAATVNTPAIQQPSRDLHAQVILNINPQVRRGPAYYPGWEARRRQLELAREREARARWAAEHPRSREYREDRRDYRRDYRYDR